MASTNLNMQLLLRRDLEFNKSYVLAAGEPGFEINTNTLKIGDGSTTWENLPIANKAAIDALIKVTDDKVVALTDVVNKLGDTYATDAEVEAIRSALDSAKLDKATYNEFIATHAMTDEAINTAVAGAKTHAETKISEFNTATVAPIAQRVADIEADYTTASEAGDIAQGKVDAFKTSIVDGIDARVKAIEDAPYATANDVAAAQGAAEAAQKDVDDLEKYVGTFPETTLSDGTKVETVVGYINAKTAGIATDANLRLLEDRLTTIEEAPYATAADINAINDEETGILAQAKAYTDAEDIFVTDMLTVDKFGGIAGGANLNGKTTHQILTDLLYPYVKFIINSSSRNAAAATLECGQSQTLSSATISVTKKKDPITSIKLFNGSTLLEEKTGDAVANGGSITFNGFDAITVTKGNNPNLKFTVTDGTSSEDKSVGASTFVYPYYWGVCAEDATIDEALVEGLTKSVSGKGTKTDISFTCAQQKIVFAYPKAHGVLKSIIDPNNFETIDGYARSEVSITGLDGSAQAYYVYVQKDACTVTGFKVDFKY